jgi:hypothetical protein
MSATSYNLVTAGVAIGRNKATILRAIKSGLISATRDERGGWCIEPAELHRVYPPLAAVTNETPYNPDTATSCNPTVSWGNWSGWGNSNPAQPPPTTAEITELRSRLADARDEIEFLRRAHTELTAERAHLTLLLTDQRKPAKPWWRRWSS